MLCDRNEPDIVDEYMNRTEILEYQIEYKYLPLNVMHYGDNKPNRGRPENAPGNRILLELLKYYDSPNEVPYFMDLVC